MNPRPADSSAFEARSLRPGLQGKAGMERALRRGASESEKQPADPQDKLRVTGANTRAGAPEAIHREPESRRVSSGVIKTSVSAFRVREFSSIHVETIGWECLH